MDKMVARLNIEHYRKQLAEQTDETQRKLLLGLLTEEEQKLASLTEPHGSRRKEG